MGIQHRTLEGQTAIVTGSSNGIGTAIAHRLGEEGANVMITGMNEERTKKVCEEVAEQHDVKSHYFLGDLSLEKNVMDMVEQTVDQLGNIDILVNNAGGGVILPFLEHDAETLKKTIDRNLWTVIWPCRYVLPHMVEQNYGRIIMVGADSVRNGLWQHAAYNAAKGGGHALTTGLAREFAPYDITVNTIAPPAVEGEQYENFKQKNPEMAQKYIDIIPKGRAAKMEEVADAVWYLASERASFITGQVISVNGGSTML
ncbi:2,3-dihydroxy-2,3-dihydro-p-cumate dehydrogenase [Alteribacillus persepolensis]|uniref:2,3-dihydroxy-2,3-dihydro-p-cumate dehydrogenase n=1 Tax=Alteribacillus persepolensis TaxID=568899 RepID=A0A1G8EE51_9BACI|nr:SDR family oxidoreductase [Alteribacillus persepolensis]SDH68192.1 2,3-dihydroxy-2,3-dihydro-p-cumate dehydrogenase [Alteribacillus persepolensis]